MAARICLSSPCTPALPHSNMHLVLNPGSIDRSVCAVDSHIDHCVNVAYESPIIQFYLFSHDKRNRKYLGKCAVWLADVEVAL